MNDHSPVFTCGHQGHLLRYRICNHLLKKRDGMYLRHFRDVSEDVGFEATSFCLLCPECAKHFDSQEALLAKSCRQCLREIETRGDWIGNTNQPFFTEQNTSLRFEHEVVPLNIQGELIAVAPLQNSSHWLLLTSHKRLYILDEATKDNRALPGLDFEKLDFEKLDFEKPIALQSSRDGDFFAIYNTSGQYGYVVDRKSYTISMLLNRQNYHEDVSGFPIAFFGYQGRSLLVHATDWNRLEITDLRDGSVLTKRHIAEYKIGERSEHYLDYFHCTLSVSPSNAWIADTGWVWQPAGVISSWNLKQWLEQNPFESEDGDSRKTFNVWQDWDMPTCWLNDTTFGVYGIGPEDMITPGIQLFDVRTGERTDFLFGPSVEPSHELTTEYFSSRQSSLQRGLFVFDTWLFSSGYGRGIEVWDIKAKSRLLRDKSFSPVSYHPTSKVFLTVLGKKIKFSKIT